MIVDDFRQVLAGGRCEVSARVRRGGSEELRLWWRLPQKFAPERIDGSPFLAGVLAWAMRHGEDIVIDAPVSPRLLANVEQIMAVYWSMFPHDLRPVTVSAPAGDPPPPVDVTGCYFSRGVDSWYAVLTALEDDPQDPPLSHVVVSPDFLSVEHWSEERIRGRAEVMLTVAQRTGCEVVTLETNLKRDFGGAQLTSSALALGFSRMLIGSGAMHGEIVPAGTHPALDHRFSSERTEIVHYGDANRLDKVARIAHSPAALDTLSVCRSNRGTGDANCGRCEKCLRTMLELHVAGALKRCPRFDRPLDALLIARQRKRLTRRHQWLEVQHALGDRPGDDVLAAAVGLVIAQSDLRRAAYELREASEDPHLGRVAVHLPAATRRATARALSAHESLDPDVPARKASTLLRSFGRSFNPRFDGRRLR